MAKALQCDRCHCFFNPLEVDDEFMHFDNPAIRTSDDYEAHLTGRYFDARAGRDGVIDLCPTCTRAFIDFMFEGGKN